MGKTIWGSSGEETGWFSDEDDGHGVGLDGAFLSDELQFTGEDLGRRSRRRKDYNYSGTSESSEESENSEDGAGRTMQLALRDKEELLVQKALERIHRAQMLGKTNVKLTQPELDALQRKKRKELATKDQAPRRNSALDLKGTDRRRSSGQSSGASKDQKPGKRKSKGYFPGYDGESSSSSRRATAPGIRVPGAIGVPAFSPLGYYPSTTAPQGRSSVSGSRSASSHSLARDSLPLPRPGNQRYSGPEPPQPSPKPRSPLSSRSLPDDPNWTPRSRSSSSATTQPYPTDPYYYQAYSSPPPQMPAQYIQGRRIVSSPQPDVHYPRVRGEAQARSSAPAVQRRG
ncbi:hypothetical protein ABVK25_005027 [Lepraria finkii]|uniref:Uncharacterized protein n=1 Tax=Lepraria finkii TaxID=1340010 RepID=A0ABR4BBC6_9LECA